ncbi:MAG TPA: amino acid ABC transporter substrate-binding protein [Caulobacteraceae bacterium]|nr:amino acid ABC transporter substrate-binding protein [Caulobacteraceae bacterium]
MKRLTAVLALCLAAAACEQETTSPPPALAPKIEAEIPKEPKDSPTLASVRQRDSLRCGVNPGLAGFALRDSRGEWRGFDADFCRALAAAVLGDARKVTFVPLTNTERIEALKSGKVDVLARNTSWTFRHDVGDGVEFAGVSYYDGQGFLAPRSLNLQSASELSGAKICVQSGSTSELNVADWFRARQLNFTLAKYPTEERTRQAYQTEQCDVITADISTLASARSQLNNPQQHALLPDVISKEPLGPVVRQGDDRWADIVRWTLNALILAEELQVTSENAAELRKESAHPEVRRLLGAEGGFGQMLGLNDDWAYRAIRAVGNYGEVFNEHLGPDSALRLERGQNALWNAPRPGLLYAPPMR